jgi:hypothetical protein
MAALHQLVGTLFLAALSGPPKAARPAIPKPLSAARRHNQATFAKLPARIVPGTSMIHPPATRSLRRRTGAALLLCGAAAFASATPQAVTTPAVDGGLYEGRLLHGLREGPGRISWPGGMHYEGGFEKGQMSGQGKVSLPGGDVYEGSFHQGQMSGQGKLVMVSQYVYEGQFRQGLFEGRGRLSSPDMSYAGEFHKGQAWGKGEQTTTEGRKYSGDFVRDRYQGKGRLETSSGDIYTGDFDAGDFSGEGSIVNKSGGHYEGRVKKWLADGKGRFTDSDGSIYEGVFSKGQLSGKGSIRQGKQHYEGDITNFRPEGEGVLHLESGDVYSGHFSNGLYHGKGILTYAKAREDGRLHDAGNWQNGVLEDKAAAKQLASDIESALYQQNRLLEKSLATLQPGTTPGGSLFFLGIAGDGAQEVFRREADFVRQQFDTDFSTRNHSIALTNSRRTLLTEPLATLSSIRITLTRLARIMTKDDILFIYMTSHGSPQQEFVLNPPGMALANLGADDLGALLQESGIRWKVLVISACYSGGFLDALKDDGTLVITAARHDRASFGCSDENDFTYFGRAYFKEALPKSHSFQEAFQSASGLVTEWENKDLKASGEKDEKYFSLPQMQNPAGIENRLKAWWQQREKTVTSPLTTRP